MEAADPWQGLQEDLQQQEEEMRFKTGGTSFQQAKTGTHLARWIRMVDLGSQHNERYGTVRRQVWVEWELPGQLIEKEGISKPLTISKFYTASMHEKANFRQDVESWVGKSMSEKEAETFDPSSMLGKPCLLSIVEHEGKSVVASVSGVPEGMEVPPQFNQEVKFWLDEYNQAQFDELPKGIQAIIEKSPEYKRAVGDSASDLEDDIPW